MWLLLLDTDEVLCGCVTHDRESWLEGNGLYQAAISLMPLSLYLLRPGLVTAPGADNGDQQKQGASGCSSDLEQQLYKRRQSYLYLSIMPVFIVCNYKCISSLEASGHANEKDYRR